jgi:hypothetical protein
MNNLPIDPNLLPLLDGVRPYLGSNAQNYADLFASMIKLLTSNSGQEVIATMGRMVKESTSNTTAADTAKNMGVQAIGPNIAFSLFLILILLLFSIGSFGWPAISMEEAGDVNTCGQPEEDQETQI